MATFPELWLVEWPKSYLIRSHDVVKDFDEDFLGE
jgi:hypothetical protein